MEMITNNYDNISINEVMSKLSQKLSQLDKIEKTEELEAVKLKKDYIEQSTSGVNYDEQDFQRVLEKFKRTDAQIKSHEQIHATIGQTTAPISYSYQQGPDGKMYAVGGHVRLDTSIPDDPKAAAFKLEQIQKAASAPGELSSADANIASQANLNKALLTLRGDENAN